MEDPSNDFPYAVVFTFDSDADKNFKWTHNWDGGAEKLTLTSLGMKDHIKAWIRERGLREYQDYTYRWDINQGVVMTFACESHIVDLKLTVLT